MAFFAIHHEYKRFQEGYFSAGAAHRTTNIIKAAAVLLIGVHKAKVAYGIAVKSNSPTLHALASPIQALTASMDTIRSKFAQGKGSATDIQNLNSAVNPANSTAAKSGFGPIHDISAPLPSGAYRTLTSNTATGGDGHPWPSPPRVCILVQAHVTVAQGFLMLVVKADNTVGDHLVSHVSWAIAPDR